MQLGTSVSRLFSPFFPAVVFFSLSLSSSLSHNCLAVIQPDRKFTCWFWNATGPKDFRFIMEIFNYLIIIHRRPSRNTQIIPRNYSRESLLKSPCPPPPTPSLSRRFSFHRYEITTESGRIPSRAYLQLHKFYEIWNWTLLFPSRGYYL